MAFFKFRNAGDESPAAPQPGESVDVLRRRARHRLIGATVLVLVAVLGFPLVFDKQPRPIPVDIPIEIPDKNKAKPLAIPAAPVADAASASAPPTASSAAAPVAQLAPVPAPTPATAPAQPPAPSQASAGKVGTVEAAAPTAKVAANSASDKLPPKPEPAKPEAKVAEKPADKPAASQAALSQSSEAARAQALLEGRAVPATAAAAPASAHADERFIVQVGAYVDAAKVRETRLKLERAGLKTFTQVAKTPEGERTRVRLGPFAKRAEAEAAAAKVKKLDMPAAILTL